MIERFSRCGVQSLRRICSTSVESRSYNVWILDETIKNEYMELVCCSLPLDYGFLHFISFVFLFFIMNKNVFIFQDWVDNLVWKWFVDMSQHLTLSRGMLIEKLPIWKRHMFFSWHRLRERALNTMYCLRANTLSSHVRLSFNIQCSTFNVIWREKKHAKRKWWQWISAAKIEL